MATLTMRERHVVRRDMRRAKELNRLRRTTLAVLNEALRRGILQITAGFNACLGASMAAVPSPTGPSFALLERIPGWPVSWGLLLLALSLVLAVGYLRDLQRWVRVGVLGVGLWQVCTGIGFGANFVMWMWEGSGEVSTPVLYASFAYWQIAAVQLLLLLVLRDLHRMQCLPEPEAASDDVV